MSKNKNNKFGNKFKPQDNSSRERSEGIREERKVKEQKGRVAGHIIENIFYVVFLDKNHRFYVTEKKNT